MDVRLVVVKDMQMDDAQLVRIVILVTTRVMRRDKMILVQLVIVMLVTTQVIRMDAGLVQFFRTGRLVLIVNSMQTKYSLDIEEGEIFYQCFY